MAATTMDTVIACTTCGQLQRAEELAPGTVALCCRCGAVVRAYKALSLERTAAFSLAALILYVPANVYPILLMNYHGAHSENTVWGGVVGLFQNDQRLVAAIVFLASILIPIVKLAALLFLVVSTQRGWARWQRERTLIYRFIEVIGPWAMLDVFLLAVLVALVKLQQIATILPGPGILAFTAMVILTILASASFDPKLIWNDGSASR